MHSRLEGLPGSSSSNTPFIRQSLTYFVASLALLVSVGCGQLKSYTATEQLLLSSAIDDAVQKLDFSPLSGKKVFVDTTFIRDGKTYGCVHDGYLISSVRQQMMADGCLLFDKREEAEVIVEARVGTLGADAHEITYGLPASSAISSAATAMGSPAPIPAIPELSLAKRTQNDGAAKLALFAFDAKSREPLWQSGVALSKTSSANTWLFGAGPWAKGTKPKRSLVSRLFGSEEKPEKLVSDEDDERGKSLHGKITFEQTHVFPALRKSRELAAATMIAKSDDKSATARVVDTSAPPAAVAAATTPPPAVAVAAKPVEAVATKEEPKKGEPAAPSLAHSAAMGGQ